MSDLERKRGDTYADEIAVTSTITDLPIDITGYSFKLTLDPDKNPIDASGNVYVLTGSIIDAANGIVGFSPSAVEADQLGTFFYDIEMTDGAGKIRTIEKGKYKYLQDITK